MKKIISILLVLVILISSLCPTSVFAAMENTNLDWTNTTNWIFNDGSSKNIGTNAGAVAYTGGSGVTVDRDTFAATRGTTLKLDSGGFYASLPLNTEKNTDYKLTFSYCSTVVANSLSVKDKAPYAFNSAGIFIPNHPEFKDVDSTYTRLGYGYAMTYLVNYASNYQMYTPAGRNWDGPTTKNKVDQNGDGNPEDGRKYDVLPNFHNIEVNTWYTLSYNFNSSDFEDIAFTFQKVADGDMWIDDIILEKSVADDDDYFENADNWILSLRGSQTDRRNISVDGTVGINFSGHKGSDYFAVDNTVSLDGQGSSVRLKWGTHPSNIALPNLEDGKSYRLKFSFKVASNSNSVVANAQIKGIGIYSPKKMEDAITAGDKTSYFTDGTLGWNVFDSYNGTGGIKRYRDETLTSCAANKNSYATVAGDYTYNTANQWYTEELYFKVTEYTDLQLVIIPGDVNSGTFLDNFEFEMVEKVPDVIETQNRVGIRAASEGSQGIRVRNSISQAEIKDKKIVSYGAIAIRKGRMAEGVTLTFDTKDIAIGVAYNTKEGNCGGKIQTEPILREQTETDNIFSCVLINIPQKYYDDIYSVRSFAIDGAGNVYYGEVIEVSVFDVVYSILKGTNANDKATANSIVNEIIEADKNDTDGKITTYSEWCTANGLADKSTAA